MNIKKTRFYQPIFMVERTNCTARRLKITEQQHPKLFARLRELANREQVTMEQMFTVLVQEEIDKMEAII